MPLQNYGLLIGKITGFREPRGHRPHWLLMVQPADAHHPAYRVALNAPRQQPTDHSEIEYQIVELDSRLDLVRKVRRLAGKAGTQSFLLADEDPKLPRLDYGDETVVKADGFPSEGRREPKVHDPERPRRTRPQPVGDLQKLLAKVAADGAMVAVFGTGAPVGAATGFTGIENVHMNQGSFNRTNGTLHYTENARGQDGGLIVLDGKKAIGVFIKFRSQTLKTDHRGHPAVTGIAEIDKVRESIRKAIMPPLPGPSRRRRAIEARSLGAAAVAHATTPATPGDQNGKGFIFADFDPKDETGVYKPDEDGDTYNTPFVQELSKGKTRGPVPTPRQNPIMTLDSVVGVTPPGYSNSASGQAIAFDIIGDSGAPSEKQLNTYEIKVADLMAKDAAASQPAFCYHVGDVVYFYGEQDYYYGQFYEPFRTYPAPIFAIPGNHDGCTYTPQMVSLDAFQRAFCAESPKPWDGAGGLKRSTMTQPGVYFTLDAPLVSIIGLYSNCGESLGFLDAPQYTFLYNELVRLKAKRQNGLPAVILAIHHMPRWFPGQKDPMSTALDATCTKAGFWPDAVICGHAHLYQRVVRPDAGKKGHDMPYILSGAGGYGIKPAQEEGKNYMQSIGATKDTPNRNGSVIFESGYVRATVTKPARGNPTLKFDYRSVKPKASGPDDSCTVDLSAGKVVG
jgi:hypothetical protein